MIKTSIHIPHPLFLNELQVHTKAMHVAWHITLSLSQQLLSNMAGADEDGVTVGVSHEQHVASLGELMTQVAQYSQTRCRK